jgi:hypothetical protein
MKFDAIVLNGKVLKAKHHTEEELSTKYIILKAKKKLHKLL